MTDQENKQLEELTEKVDRVYQGLFGIPGTEEKGMCGRLNDVCSETATLKRNFFILCAFLVGSGILGAGIWGLIIK